MSEYKISYYTLTLIVDILESADAGRRKDWQITRELRALAEGKVTKAYYGETMTELPKHLRDKIEAEAETNGFEYSQYENAYIVRHRSSYQDGFLAGAKAAWKLMQAEGNEDSLENWEKIAKNAAQEYWGLVTIDLMNLEGKQEWGTFKSYIWPNHIAFRLYEAFGKRVDRAKSAQKRIAELEALLHAEKQKADVRGESLLAVTRERDELAAKNEAKIAGKESEGMDE